MISKWNLFILLFLFSQVESQFRVSYNATCRDGIIRCDSKKSLTCIDNRCKCVKPNEMIFDNEREKCVVIASERCSYTAVEILTSNTQEKRWTEKLDCVKHAICNTDGYCACETNYFENSGGICSPKRTQDEPCTTDTQCRTDLHLTCQKGICSCNTSEAIVDNTQKTCIGKVGASCSKYGNKCVLHAVCQTYDSYYGSRNLGKCRCDAPRKTSNKGLCSPSYGMTCDHEVSPCSEEFACIDGKCKCHFPKHQFNNNTNSACISYVRGPCQETVNDDNPQIFPCVDNAVCEKSRGFFECQCQNEYIESADRKCKLAYGSSCKTTSVCDNTANLICKYGKCSCEDFEIYDGEKYKCRGLAGAQCNITSVEDNYCVTGAFCDSYRDMGIQKGTCSCSPSFLTGTDRKCSPPLPPPPPTFLPMILKNLEVNGSRDDSENEISNSTAETVETMMIQTISDETSS